MNMKSILLASAAAVVATSAFAADAMKPEAAPVAANYVKVCDTFGAGYFYIPGGDTCLKIDGRVRFGVTYGSANHTGTAFTDGRVAFETAQATDFGVAKSSIRFDYNGANSSTAVNVGEANLAIGDFFAGYNHGEIHEFYDFFSLGYDDNGVLPLAGRYNLDDYGGTALGVLHDFGGGFSAGAEVVGGTAGSYTFTGSNVTNPVIEAEATYTSGALTANIGGVYDSATKIGNTQGGYSIGGNVKYAVTSSLTGGIGLIYKKAGVDNGLTYIDGALSYAITPKYAVYANGTYGFGNSAAGLSDSRAAVEAGLTYTIATNFTANVEEDYIRPTSGTTNWQTLFKLERDF